MLITFTLSGLWHGAAWNFVLWGLYYGILLVLEKYIWGKRLEKLPSVLRHAYTILIVTIGFVLFVFDDMQALGLYFTAMAGQAGNALAGSECLWYLQEYGVVFFTALLLAFPFYPWLKGKLEGIGTGGRRVLSVLTFFGYGVLFLLTTAYLVNDTYNPFLYFRF